MISKLSPILSFFKRRPFLILALTAVFLLRIPNFFEPYWYGDEAIYLAIGNGLRGGERLYAEIIDHKTPLIYYFAMTPHQLLFRLLNVTMMLAATVLFYRLVEKLFSSRLSQWFATTIFVLLTTLPWFEGHIPNGELFVLFFVLVGLTLFARTSFFTHFFQSSEQKQKKTSAFLSPKMLPWYFATGVFCSLGILTKVPGLFDMFAVLSICWFFLVTQVFIILQKKKFTAGDVFSPIGVGVIIFVGVLTPLLLSVLYYIMRGSGQAYLDYGLLYNFRYAGSWGLPFGQPLLFLFSLPGKALLLIAWFIALTLMTRILPKHFLFTAAWFGLALFASLLSNRPYPHYYLQVVAPIALVSGSLLSVLLDKRGQLVTKAAAVGVYAVGGVLFGAVLLLLNVRPYGTVEYYDKFMQLATGKVSWESYRNSFNGLMKDNYAAAPLIKTSNEPRFFIWGNNPMLYALTKKAPTGRFTVAFHIHDFKAYDETLNSVKHFQPQYIVIMKEERPFPEFEAYVHQNYLPNHTFEHFTLWVRHPLPIISGNDTTPQ